MTFRTEGVQMTPLLAYGTLRNGQPNSQLWKGLAAPRQGRYLVDGYILFVPDYRSKFPYALHTGNSSDKIVVDVLDWFDQSSSRIGMEYADWLEGYPYHYDRQLAPIYSEFHGSDEMGWLYQLPWASFRSSREMIVIEDGDWISHLARLASYDNDMTTGGFR